MVQKTGQIIDIGQLRILSPPRMTLTVDRGSDLHYVGSLTGTDHMRQGSANAASSQYETEATQRRGCDQVWAPAKDVNEDAHPRTSSTRYAAVLTPTLKLTPAHTPRVLPITRSPLLPLRRDPLARLRL